VVSEAPYVERERERFRVNTTHPNRGRGGVGVDLIYIANVAWSTSNTIMYVWKLYTLGYTYLIPTMTDISKRIIKCVITKMVEREYCGPAKP